MFFFINIFSDCIQLFGKECLTEEAIEVCGETRGWEGTRSNGGGTKNCSFGKGEATFIQIVKGPKKCRKGCRCLKTGRRKLCRRGSATWTWKVESRNIIEQGVLLRELSSRRRMLRGRSFVRIWRRGRERECVQVKPSSWWVGTEMLWVQAAWRMMMGRLWLRKISWWKSGEHIW